MNTAVRWIQPYNFTQNMPGDVDYRVMVTFFDFYEVFLGFVLFKLFNDVGIRYPFTSIASDNGESSTILAAHLKVLRRERNTAKEAIVEAASRTTTKRRQQTITRKKLRIKKRS